MWRYLPELLAVPVPRYTSYPTAAEFGDAGEDDFLAELDNATGDVSLYVHIPYCHEICWYCGCNTGAANRQKRLAAYLEALTAEIAHVGHLLPRSARVRHIAFGGGSPNAIAPHEFVRLVNTLTVAFSLADPTLSVELDPRSLTEPWREVLAHVGVTRASLGVQTFDPAIQQAIGRVQPIELIERAVDMLRDAGVTSLNFDLMYGLPGQDLDTLHSTLDQAARMGADRIALFGLAHLPAMFPRQRRIDCSTLPGAFERFRMMEEGHDRLLDLGYQPVGFDHFALPGDPLARAALSGHLHRNFQGFTDDAAPVTIGLGASAISNFPRGIFQNEKNAGAYRELIAAGRQPTARGVARDANDQKRRAVITGILCQGRAAVDEDMLRSASPRLADFFAEGLCTLIDGELVLAPDALPYARGIAACFDRHRADSQRNFSNAV
ncbi:oxygen-independent coproporphyrinogen III oxidase [Croceicoccus naphthovorans]|uniref:Coproporphyrinogen-III oxidase n=2 Tax=Croceicoccus naphthovorans TaxID=1348774 RepID=A0A0G3XLR6_9SPHN|nr:oxygen-independent coproporphyrinogen III oxidase [Croceicoccus naphthovorans]AKM11556.1 coproporphyrinogen III oxidase [Croceicoccus naphthovorans]MBB3989735.1 oxygen-independent coproporphyrinogen-3 oxidase [Croceicoccus naphthovorans]